MTTEQSVVHPTTTEQSVGLAAASHPAQAGVSVNAGVAASRGCPAPLECADPSCARCCAPISALACTPVDGPSLVLRAAAHVDAHGSLCGAQHPTTMQRTTAFSTGGGAGCRLAPSPGTLVSVTPL